jgi:NADPH:quinone reductase-like Zn-dependent oxidoreductase
LFAVQLAKMLGARVIVSTSSQDKAQRVREELAADQTIDYRDEHWPETVRELTGGMGVDVVVETAGGETLARSIQSCGYGARVGVIGVLDGLQANVNVFQIVMHQVQLRGIYMESAAELQQLMRAVETAQLHPVVDRVFDFDSAPQAYTHLQSGRHMGKVVVRCEGEMGSEGDGE